MGLLSHLVVYAGGIYSGIFIAQNYDLAKVEEPGVVLDKIKKYLEDLFKPKP